MTPVRVGVLGAAGRMGSTVCSAVEGDPELELVARIDEGDDLRSLVEARADVAVDFTTPAAVKDNVLFCVGEGVHAVVGTTGLSSDDLEEIRAAAVSGRANVFIAPNFALGAVLMMRFAVQAARFYSSVEVIERHHERKLDAPSGTALRTAQLITEALTAPLARNTDEKETLSGSRGGDADGVKVHSLRLPGSVAHQEVIFGGPGETLTIRHDSIDRASFMPGVLLAVKKIAALPGVTVGLENLLDV